MDVRGADRGIDGEEGVRFVLASEAFARVEPVRDRGRQILVVEEGREGGADIAR